MVDALLVSNQEISNILSASQSSRQSDLELCFQSSRSGYATQGYNLVRRLNMKAIARWGLT